MTPEELIEKALLTPKRKPPSTTTARWDELASFLHQTLGRGCRVIRRGSTSDGKYCNIDHVILIIHRETGTCIAVTAWRIVFRCLPMSRTVRVGKEHGPFTGRGWDIGVLGAVQRLLPTDEPVL